MNNAGIFGEKYRSLGGVLGADFFEYPSSQDDETAEKIFGPPDGPDAANLRLSMEALVDDCHGVLENIDETWKELAHKSNRRLSGAREASEWLSRMTAIWENWLVEQEKAAKK